MKTKIEIKTYLGSLLFSFESENNTLKKTLEKAVKSEANLRGADLRGANLYGANLCGADLYGANLYGANLRGAKNFKMYWHIHHEVLVENLYEPLKNRIKYIKEEKAKNETPEQIKLRLKLLKKVKCKPENYPVNKEGWEKLHKKECKNCTWDGNSIL